MDKHLDHIKELIATGTVEQLIMEREGMRAFEKYISNYPEKLQMLSDKISELRKLKKPRFTFFWLDGTREVVEGANSSNALAHSSYGIGALKSLDFWADGDNDNYDWNANKKKWIKKV